jgi:dihydrofolate reductase
MSLDGFIADLDGGYDWIEDVPSPDLDTTHQIPFDEYLRDLDVVVMGRRCYEQGQHTDFVRLGKPVIVAASTPPAEPEAGVEFTADVLGRVRHERDQGRHCYLFGGGRLVSSFIEADQIDELTIGIVPVLLGDGRRLFHAGPHRVDLRLVGCTVLNGKTRLTFRRRSTDKVH